MLSQLYIFVFNIWRNCDSVHISRGGFVFIQHLGVRQKKDHNKRLAVKYKIERDFKKMHNQLKGRKFSPKIRILSCQTQTDTRKIVDRMLTICSVLGELKDVHTSFRLASKKKINSLWRYSGIVLESKLNFVGPVPLD